MGTISIEKSEILSKMLKKEGVPHSVLNAKHHEKEAEIVAQAGKLGAVTIATNMAGRGTDIMLGGNAEYLALNDLRKSGMPEELIVEANAYSETENPEILAARRAYQEAYEKHKAEISKEAEQVRAAGGLFIVGTERHESRRIDNQLRGRAGRQGDPGETRFYLSLEDDVMRLFGSDRIKGMMETMGLDEDTPIDAKILSGAIENAQKNVESRNYQTRKNVLEYDDVMNTQRKVIYGQRSQVLEGEDLQQQVAHMMEVVAERNVNAAFGEQPHISRSDFTTPSFPLRWNLLPQGRVELHRRGAQHPHQGAGRGGSPGHHEDLLPEEGSRPHLPRDAGARARGDPPGGGRILDGSPGRHDRPAPGHRPARLRPERPRGGV